MIDVPLIYWLVPRTGMAKMVCLDVFPTLRLVCSRIRQNVKAATSDIESASSDPNRLYTTNQINHVLQGSPMTFQIQNYSMPSVLAFSTKFQFSKFHMEKCEKMKSLVKNTDHLK